jgi:DNA-binding IclR family transcriptional regulator
LSIKSVHKALAVLEAVAKERDGLTAQEISSQLDLPYATAHRILSTLHSAGYLSFQKAHKVYRTGPRLLNLYGSVTQQDQLGRLVYPPLSKLSHDTKETVHLAIRHVNEVLYLETILPPHSFVMYTPAGSRSPIHSTALGKAMVAFSADEEIETLLEDYEFQRFTPNTIGSADELWAEIHQIRQVGYAIDKEESSIGVRCIASIVANQAGYPEAAISASASANRLDSEQTITEFAVVVCAACREASKAIGGMLGPDPKLWYEELLKHRGFGTA